MHKTWLIILISVACLPVHQAGAFQTGEQSKRSTPASGDPVMLQYAHLSVLPYTSLDRLAYQSLRAREIDIEPVPISAHVARFHELNKPNYNRVAIISGLGAGTGIGIHYYMQNAWWSGLRGPFHYREAFTYANNLDKFGHVYAGYLTSFVFFRMVNWTGLNESRSVWYGASLGLLFQLNVEVKDGFSTRWGFERWDAIANLIGASFFVARHYIQPLQYFQLKFSYYPSPRYGEVRWFAEDTDKVQNWIDDYEGHTYWISFRAGRFLKNTVNAPDWLKFINIAGGWSLSDFREHTEFYLALDWNLEELPGSNWYLRRLWEGLDMLKLPAPAVRLAPGGAVWYGVYL